MGSTGLSLAAGPHGLPWPQSAQVKPAVVTVAIICRVQDALVQLVALSGFAAH